MPAEATTTLGKSVLIRGDITGSEDLFIDGRVDGVITLKENKLTIGPNAVVHAELYVQNLVIHGRQEGKIDASGSVELRQTAQVLGDVNAARLSIEENAVISGKILLTGKERAV